MLFVLILPMRNGNNSRLVIRIALSSFLSYLWGMETYSCIFYMYSINHWFLSYLWGMETKHEQRFPLSFPAPVLILPMRNGNSLAISLSHHTLQGVLILPMRNGNIVESLFQKIVVKVLILPMRNGNQLHCQISKVSLIRSYPTYEEWKPHKQTRS